MKIQFACGENRLEGWQNFDCDLDLYKLPLPFQENIADRILCEHFIEHCDGPQALRLLDEFYRILKPGGILRICCPVIEGKVSREHARDLALGHGHKMVLNPSSMNVLLWMAGFHSARISETGRKPEDGHWKVIGQIKDDLETCRMEGEK